MSNKFNSFSTSILLTLFLVVANLNTSYCQNDTCQIIKSKLETIQNNHFQERLFVHIDKTFYLVGENLWMKFYVTDALLHKSSDLSKLVYVEILNSKQKPILRSKYKLDGGFGDGSIKIPQSLLSGSYTLRAYTQWMRNDGPDSFFEQTLTVVNTLNDEAKSPNFPIRQNIQFQFFPEGGNLIEGVESKIAFKATNSFEQGLNCHGFLLNDKNDTLIKFNSFKFGMGNFKFNPQANEKYKAIVFVGDSIINPIFPIVSRFGYNIVLTDTSKKELSIQVNKVGNLMDDKLYLLVHGAQFTGSAFMSKIQSGKSIFKIDKKELKEGVNKITIFNTFLKPVCERAYFNYPINRLKIQLNSNQEVFDKRTEIQLGVGTSNDSINSNLSVSVFLIDSVQNLSTVQDIESYMFLSNELKGWVESPSAYFDSSLFNESDKFNAIDNLMLTQGWSKFSLTNENTSNKSSRYLPELEGPLVHANITNKKSGLPAKQVLTYFSIPGKPFYFATSKSDNNGNLLFNLKTDLNATEAIIQTDPANDSNYSINVIDPFEPEVSKKHKTPFMLPVSLKSILLNRSISAQSENIFDKKNENEEVQLDTLPFFGKPSNSYYLDLYTRFTSMEELTREYVKEIKLKEKGKDFSMVLWNSRFQLFNEGPPLLLMDGVPIFNTNKLLEFDPLKISKIDILTETNYTGNLFSNGIVSYSTYNGDLAGYPIDPNALLMQYEGVQSSRTFYSPIYTNRLGLNQTTPDLRNVLYWNPNLILNNINKKINFYSSDLTGRFVIFIQGLSNNGLMGSCFKYIDIK
jgi:hypothetical protein